MHIDKIAHESAKQHKSRGHSANFMRIDGKAPKSLKNAKKRKIAKKRKNAKKPLKSLKKPKKQKTLKKRKIATNANLHKFDFIAKNKCILNQGQGEK